MKPIGCKKKMPAPCCDQCWFRFDRPKRKSRQRQKHHDKRLVSEHLEGR